MLICCLFQVLTEHNIVSSHTCTSPVQDDQVLHASEVGGVVYLTSLLNSGGDVNVYNSVSRLLEVDRYANTYVYHALYFCMSIACIHVFTVL